MRVAVFRAVDDGRRTAARLTQMGHEAVLAPVIRIVPTGAGVPDGTADALIFTSAHAPEALALCDDAVGLKDMPCWCVGGQTAAAARTAGFTDVRTGPGDGAGLAADIAARVSAGARLTLVAGRERKPNLEMALAQAGLGIAVVEAYAAEAVAAWGEEVGRDLQEVGAAVHFSRRSALLAHGLAQASGLASAFLCWSHHCLSADVAAALQEHGRVACVVAAKPDEASLLASLSPG